MVRNHLKIGCFSFVSKPKYVSEEKFYQAIQDKMREAELIDGVLYEDFFNAFKEIKEIVKKRQIRIVDTLFKIIDDSK